jgi:hypothetical protein
MSWFNPIRGCMMDDCYFVKVCNRRYELGTASLPRRMEDV